MQSFLTYLTNEIPDINKHEGYDSTRYNHKINMVEYVLNAIYVLITA